MRSWLMTDAMSCYLQVMMMVVIWCVVVDVKNFFTWYTYINLTIRTRFIHKAINISDSRTTWKNKKERNGEEKSNAALTAPMKPQDTHIFLLNFFSRFGSHMYAFYTQNGRRKKAKINSRNIVTAAAVTHANRPMKTEWKGKKCGTIQCDVRVKSWILNWPFSMA